MWTGRTDPAYAGAEAANGRRRPGVGTRRSTAAVAISLVALSALAACEREEPEAIGVSRQPREAAQAAPAGEVVARMQSDAEPDVTIYEPPPDLSRTDIGVVYVPETRPPAVVGPDSARPGITGPSAPPTRPVPRPDTLRRRPR